MERALPVSKLPKHDAQRNAIAARLHDVREGIRGGATIKKRRPYWEMEITHAGVEGFLTYAASLQPRTIVDIGTGVGYVAQELYDRFHGQGVTVSATDIITYPESQGLTVPIELTSAEVMRGFAPESVSGILSTHGIDYGINLAALSARLDEILVPGGVIQTVFAPETASSPLSGIFLPPAQVLADYLHSVLHYDTAVQVVRIGENRYSSVCIAIKPGGQENTPTALELLSENNRSVQKTIPPQFATYISDTQEEISFQPVGPIPTDI